MGRLQKSWSVTWFLLEKESTKNSYGEEMQSEVREI